MVIANNRGFLRLIEMALAATLIIAFLIFIQQTQSSFFRATPISDVAVLQSAGQDLLRTLDLRDNDTDGRSDLRQRIGCNEDRWSKLEVDIKNHLPPSMGFMLYSVDENGVASYKGGLSAGTAPRESEIVVVSYVVAGEYGNYSNSGSGNSGKPCNIRLLLWFNR